VAREHHAAAGHLMLNEFLQVGGLASPCFQRLSYVSCTYESAAAKARAEATPVQNFLLLAGPHR